jgi:hypothetical protein
MSATSQSYRALPPLHFATPAWGTKYVSVFLDTTLPTLLAPGNIPALPNPERCVYRIFTLAADLPLIRGHTAYASLSKLLRVELVDAAELFNNARGRNSTKYDWMTAAYNEALHRADCVDAATVFINADMVFSNRSFSNLVAIVSSGKRAVEIEGFRTNKEAVEQSLQSRWRTKSGAIDIPSRELVKLALANIHRVSRKHFWKKSVSKSFIPFHTYWWVGRSGVISRASHLYPLLVFPDRKFASLSKTIDQNLLDETLLDVESTHIVSDSDVIFSCELSDRDYDIDEGPYVPFAEKRFSSTFAFVRDTNQCSERHRNTLKTPILIHADDASTLAWRWAKFSTALWVAALSQKGVLYIAYLSAEKRFGALMLIRICQDLLASASRAALSVLAVSTAVGRRVWRQISYFGWRAVPAMLAYGALIPFLGRVRAREIGIRIRGGR